MRNRAWLKRLIARHALLRTLREQWRQQRATAARRNSRATFIGITGSSAKSTSKVLLTNILKASGKVAPARGNEIKKLIVNLRLAPRDADFFVAECGIGNVGKMRPMARLLRPHVALVTMIGLEHKSTMRSRERIAEEKSELVAAVQPGGFAVLNADDPLVMGMAAQTRERIVTFGRSADAHYRAVKVEGALPNRLTVHMRWPGGTVELKTRFVGEHFWLPTLAAAAAAMELGVPAEIVAERVASFEPLFARFSVLTVPQGPTFLIDTVKAPWYSLGLAFDTVAAASAARKRIVLGHMSDFAGSDSKYRDAYRLAAAVADQVVFVGNHAHRSKASQEDRDSGRFLAFRAPEEAADFIRRTSIPEELILLKGSEDLHLERVALSMLHDVKCWQAACRRRVTCLGCGLYAHPFELHRGRRTRLTQKV